MVYQAMGTATNIEMTINFKKSLVNIIAILFTDAPNTFLIPISFTFCVAACNINPYRPKQAISKDIIDEYIRISENRFSAKYCSPIWASTKLKSSNADGKCFLQTCSTQVVVTIGLLTFTFRVILENR